MSNAGLSMDEIVSSYIKELMWEQDDRTPMQLNDILLQNGISFKTIRTITYLDWLQHFVKTPRVLLKDNLSFDNSRFFNTFKNSCFDPKIPHISIQTEHEHDSKLQGIFDLFPFFKFGGIAFTCSHKLLPEYGIFPGTPNTEDKDNFEMHYGIKIDKVSISLDELQSVAEFGDTLSEIEDCLIVGKHGNTELTIIDNDLDYSANGSDEKYECHFKPVLCVDRGVPVKYIKIIDDNHPFQHKYIPERRYEYALQRKQTLKKLNNVFKQPSQTNNQINGYPTDIDFIIKTGLRQFAFLSYDRFKNNGDFWITNVCYNTDGSDPKTMIKKCSAKDLQQNISALLWMRANHFYKLYGPKTK